MRPRIPTGDRHDVGPVNWVIAAVSGRVAGCAPLNRFLTLGPHTRLFRGGLWFAGRLRRGGRLPRRDTELVIVRVAHLRDCAYELEHHRRLARRAGLTATDIERVLTGPDAPEWSSRERALLTACDELHHAQDLSDSTWQALSEHLDDRLIIELVLLVGNYQMLATAIAALRIEPDRPR